MNVCVYHPWGYGCSHQGCSWKTFLSGRVGQRLAKKKDGDARWTIGEETDLKMTCLSPAKRNEEVGDFCSHKITRMLMVDIWMAIRLGGGGLEIFWSLVSFCSWEVLKESRPFRWHSTGGWVMFNQSQKMNYRASTTNSHHPKFIMWWVSILRSFYITNDPSTTNWGFWWMTTVSPIKLEPFCQSLSSNALGRFVQPGRVDVLDEGTKDSNKWWKDFSTPKNRRCTSTMC